jgi:hypothetical protein
MCTHSVNKNVVENRWAFEVKCVLWIKIVMLTFLIFLLDPKVNKSRKNKSIVFTLSLSLFLSLFLFFSLSLF